MSTSIRARSTVVAIVMILGLPASLLAQGTGAISGTVSDTTGGVLPGATIVVTSIGFGAKLSVNGSRYTANLFTIDGTILNDQFNQAGSASGTVLGVEASGEFQVLTKITTLASAPRQAQFGVKLVW